MQKPDEWASDSDFTNNSESENNINGTNEDKPDNTEEDPSRNEDKPDGTEQHLSEDDGSVLSDNEEDNYFIRLNREKTIHVITQDNIPLLYVDTIEDAKLIMWELARGYRTNWFSNYNTYIREGSNQNKIEITGNYRYLLIFYEKLLSTFEIYSIHELFKEN